MVAMVRLPASVVRASFADLINRVAYGGERVVVTRREKPIAALVPITDFERLADTALPSAVQLSAQVAPELLEEIRREAYERAHREVYEQVRVEAQKRLESLISGRREPI
ncbi:MAG: type II toxin-antitoxin system Phd/YefM family antitoxin [Magnetospirillum sp. WYHS-4]